jgi:hypothetical protein
VTHLSNVRASERNQMWVGRRNTQFDGLAIGKSKTAARVLLDG